MTNPVDIKIDADSLLCRTVCAEDQVLQVLETKNSFWEVLTNQDGFLQKFI
jgi:hypothetical protein